MTLCQRGYFIQIFHPAQGPELFFKWKLHLESIHSFSALVGFVDDLGEVIKNKQKKKDERTPKELTRNWFPLERRAVLGIVQRVVSGEVRKIERREKL